MNLKRHVDCSEKVVDGETVSAALDKVFESYPKLRSYILDDQGSLHRHMAIIVNGEAVTDRSNLAHPVNKDDEIYVMQALSGG